MVRRIESVKYINLLSGLQPKPLATVKPVSIFFQEPSASTLNKLPRLAAVAMSRLPIQSLPMRSHLPSL